MWVLAYLSEPNQGWIHARVDLDLFHRWTSTESPWAQNQPKRTQILDVLSLENGVLVVDSLVFSSRFALICDQGPACVRRRPFRPGQDDVAEPVPPLMRKHAMYDLVDSRASTAHFDADADARWRRKDLILSNNPRDGDFISPHLATKRVWDLLLDYKSDRTQKNHQALSSDDQLATCQQIGIKICKL